MCEIGDDDGYASVWSEKQRRARKQHRCTSCGGSIRPGDLYLNHFSIFEGDATSARLCAACDGSRDEFSHAHEGTLLHPETLLDSLVECVEQEPEMAPKWQPMIDAIRQRREETRAERDAEKKS
jgi:hypothetical protein